MKRTILISFILFFCISSSSTISVQAQTVSDTLELGKIHFPTSCSSDAQAHFVRGVLLLHSFEYDRSREAFQKAERLDSDCVMAYWGEAMTYNHPLWNEQNRKAARAALKKLAPTTKARLAKAPTDRVRSWLDAVEILYGKGPKAHRDTLYYQAMKRLVAQYPDDVEARAFYALSILGLSQGVRNHRSYMRAGAIALDIFRKHPHHPGAMHYAIHAFDDPIHAPLALAAARAYAKIVPNAAHAQHMASHIFEALGMWDGVVTANLKATAVVARRADVAKGSGFEHWPTGHYAKWLLYGYIQQGRRSEARELFKNALEVAKAHDGMPPYVTIATMRARLVASAPKEIRIRACNTTNIVWPEFQMQMPMYQQRKDFADGLCALRRGDVAKASSALAAMVSRRKKLLADRKNKDSVPIDISRLKIMEQVLRARIFVEKGKRKAAAKELRQAVALQKSLPMAFGPPRVIQPPSELLGEVLLALERPKEAIQAFQHQLKRSPRKPRTLLGLARAYVAVGKQKQAIATYQKLLTIWDQADPDLPGAAEARQYLQRTVTSSEGSQNRK